jgi:colicin import membrane protein
MKRIAVIALVLVAATAHAQVQEDAPVIAERARLKAQRSKVEAEFAAQERACYSKFAVTDCLEAARAKRRDAVSDLHRQEIALNDMARKRNAAERRHSIDEKNAVQREREENPPPKAPDAQRTLHSNERKARDNDVQKRQAEIESARQRREADAAKAAREHAEKLVQAREREERVKKRLAEKKKAPASSLKDPG